MFCIAASKSFLHFHPYHGQRAWGNNSKVDNWNSRQINNKKIEDFMTINLMDQLLEFFHHYLHIKEMIIVYRIVAS